MRILQVILCFAFATGVSFSFSLNRQNSQVRMKRQVDCRSAGHSIWSSWGPCYAVKHKMERRRYRLPRGFSFFSNICPKVWQYQECKGRDITRSEDFTKCEFTEWSDWDDCEYTNTKLYKERHRVLKQSTEGGLKCSEVNLADFTEHKECIDDCSWTTWTPCYKYILAAGERERYDRYRIKESKLHKNLRCSYTAQFQDCYFCEWATWTNWGTCQKGAENYRQRIRRRTRQYSNSIDGKLCSLLHGADVLDVKKCIPQETTPNPNPHDNTETNTHAATYAMPMVKIVSMTGGV